MRSFGLLYVTGKISSDGAHLRFAKKVRHLLDEGIVPNLRLSKLVVAFAEFLCYTGL